MDGKYPSIYRKLKATVLLLCLFFMMANSCPVRNLLSGSLSPSVEVFKQAKSAKQRIHSDTFVYAETIMNDKTHCTATTITEASFMDLSTLSSKSLPLPLFLAVVSLYLTLSILSVPFGSFTAERKRSLNNSLPLFLQNRSIII